MTPPDRRARGISLRSPTARHAKRRRPPDTTRSTLQPARTRSGVNSQLSGGASSTGERGCESVPALTLAPFLRHVPGFPAPTATKASPHHRANGPMRACPPRDRVWFTRSPMIDRGERHPAFPLRPPNKNAAVVLMVAAPATNYRPRNRLADPTDVCAYGVSCRSVAPSFALAVDRGGRPARYASVEMRRTCRMRAIIR